jgi:hypothetical protein
VVDGAADTVPLVEVPVPDDRCGYGAAPTTGRTSCPTTGSPVAPPADTARPRR